MLVLMEHPQHGRTHVYSPLALEQHVANGWIAVDENKPHAEAEKPLSEPIKGTLKLPKKAK